MTYLDMMKEREFRFFNCTHTDKDWGDTKTEEIRMTVWNDEKDWQTERAVKMSLTGRGRRILLVERIYK